MKVGFLITARLKSTRLPEKLMIDLAGRKVIEHVIDRAKRIDHIDEIVLCTSKDPQDDPLIDVAEGADIRVFRGSPDDVLDRLLKASEQFGLDQFLGITGENALFSVQHANEMCRIVRKEDPDHTFLSGLPIGCAIYAAKVKALKVVCAIKEIVDTEIWGYLLNRPDVFFVRGIDASAYGFDPKLRVTLDHPEDLQFFNAVFEKLDPARKFDIMALKEVLDQNPEFIQIHGHLVQADLKAEIKAQINEMFLNKRSEILELRSKAYEGS